MKKSKPLTNKKGDVRELKASDMAKFKDAEEVLSPVLYKKLVKASKVGRPKKDDPKVMTSLRLDREVLDGLKATGKGWQTSVNQILREWVENQH